MKLMNFLQSIKTLIHRLRCSSIYMYYISLVCVHIIFLFNKTLTHNLETLADNTKYIYIYIYIIYYIYIILYIMYILYIYYIYIYKLQTICPTF